MSDPYAKLNTNTNKGEKMGNNTSTELANLSEYGIDISLEQQIAIQLTSNHYPPVPLSMVQPCIDAIDACNLGEEHSEIELPDGVEYKGRTTAPAWAIVEQHHLSAWLDYDGDEYYLDFE